MHEILESKVFETAFSRHVNWQERLFRTASVLFSMWDQLSERDWTFKLVAAEATSGNPAPPSQIATNLEQRTITFSINHAHDPFVLIDDVARTLKTVSQHDEAEEIATRKNIPNDSGWNQLIEDATITSSWKSQGSQAVHFSPPYYLSTPSDYILQEAVRLFDANYFGKLVRAGAEREFLGTNISLRKLPSLVDQKDLDHTLSMAIKEAPELVNEVLALSIRRLEFLDYLFRNPDHESWRPSVKLLKPADPESLLDITLPFWDELRLNFSPLQSQGFVSPFKAQTDTSALNYIRKQMLHSPHCHPEAIRKEIAQSWHGLVPFQPGRAAAETLINLFESLDEDETSGIVEGLRRHQSYLLPTSADVLRAEWKKSHDLVSRLLTQDLYVDAARTITKKTKAGLSKTRARYYAKDTARHIRLAKKDVDYTRTLMTRFKIVELDADQIYQAPPLNVHFGIQPVFLPGGLSQKWGALTDEALMEQVERFMDQERYERTKEQLPKRSYGPVLGENALYETAYKHLEELEAGRRPAEYPGGNRYLKPAILL